MRVFVMRNTDTYVYMLIYHQMPSLSASLDQIQKVTKVESIYLFTEKEKLYDLNYTF